MEARNRIVQQAEPLQDIVSLDHVGKVVGLDLLDTVPASYNGATYHQKKVVTALDSVDTLSS